MLASVAIGPRSLDGVRTGAGRTDEQHSELLCCLGGAAAELPFLQGFYPSLKAVDDALEALDFIVDVAHVCVICDFANSVGPKSVATDQKVGRESGGVCERLRGDAGRNWTSCLQRREKICESWKLQGCAGEIWDRACWRFF